MPNCIFCKIINNEIPSAKIWEDKKFLAILDAFPNTKGMALIMPKKHYDSDVIEMEDKIYKDFFLAAKKVARFLKKGLKVNRVAMVMEGMGVNHAHIKLYPLYGVGPRFKAVWAGEKVFFDKYQGYLTTQIGPQADLKKMEKLAKIIKERNK
jgi:diadenosine tetraphosphate (Ap4A) HIT family hydrolase